MMYIAYLLSKISGGLVFYPWKWRKINKRHQTHETKAKHSQNTTNNDSIRTNDTFSDVEWSYWL